MLFDFRGHGESDRPPAGAYSMDAFAADLDTVAAAYGATRMVGVSLGAGAALRLLRSHPDRFERLVFVLPARVSVARDLAAALPNCELIVYPDRFALVRDVASLATRVASFLAV